MLIGAALLLYTSFQSISLDDFDSFSFRLALDHFDIALQQPHPPGFPVYVALGKIVYAVTGDPRLALTLISAIFGVAGVGTLAWLGANMASRRAGVLAALWIMLLPGYWLTSELALSDVPGVVLTVLAIGCLWESGKRTSPRRRKGPELSAGGWLIAGAAMSGLCLGLRPQNALPVALFALYSLIRLYARVKAGEIGRNEAVRWSTLAIGAGAIAVLLWLIPVVSLSGGLDAYRRLVAAHSAHVYQIDSLFGQRVTAESIGERIAAFGAGVAALMGGSPVAILGTTIVLIVGLARVPWRSAGARLCAAWFVISVVQVF